MLKGFVLFELRTVVPFSRGDARMSQEILRCVDPAGRVACNLLEGLLGDLPEEVELACSFISLLEEQKDQGR